MPSSDERWGAEATRLGFTLIPNLLFRFNALERTKGSERITPSEMLVLLTILSHRINQQVLPYPGIERIARYTNMSGRHVRRIIESLVRKNFLSIHRHGELDGRRISYNPRPLIEKLNEASSLLENDINQRMGEDIVTKLEVAERLGLFHPVRTLPN